MLMRVFFKRLCQAYSKKTQIKKDKSYFTPAYLKQFNSQTLKHNPNKTLPQSDLRNILITSALPYVNNTPHLGNIIGAVLSADVYARFCRLMGYNVLYICGTDQYGTATEVKSREQKTTPQQICDKYHHIHKSIYEWFDISFDHFGRTSRPHHKTITQDIFKQIYKNGFITEKQSTQVYCSHCDLFLADRFVHGKCKKCGHNTRGDQCDNCSTIFNNCLEEIYDLKCSICKQSPQPRYVTHLYLKLGEQTSNLKKWLSQGSFEKWSNNAKGVTKGWLNSPPHQRCITRDLKWGVPVPLEGYQNKVFYVWFEAPLGYISITADFIGEGYKNWWIKDQKIAVQLKQFMGKDNILFHSIICPASLMSTDQDWQLPQKLAVTEYLTYEGTKFSKSNGIGVFGDQCQETGISVDCWRYYLLRIRPQNYDTQFSWSDFASKCNKELLNSIGNLVQRVLKYTYKSYGSSILPLKAADLSEDETKLMDEFSLKIKQFKQNMENINIVQGMVIVTELSYLLNQYVGKTQFWNNSKKQIILAFLIRMIRIFSFILEPFTPSLCAKIGFLLGCPQRSNQGVYLSIQPIHHALYEVLSESTGLRDPIPLVKQITEVQLKLFRSKFGGKSS